MTTVLNVVAVAAAVVGAGVLLVFFLRGYGMSSHGTALIGA